MGVAQLEIERVETPARVEQLAAEGWDDLVRAMPRPSPFLLTGWIVPWLEHRASGARTFVHVARRGGVLAGVLPLVVRRRGRLRVAEFVGGQQSQLSDVLLADDDDAETVRALVEHAVGGFDFADLYGVPARNRLSPALGTRLELIERVEAPVLELDAPFADVYARKLSSQRRQGYRRKRRKLGELGEVSVGVARTPEELTAALGEARELHRLRWHGRPDGSGFATDAGFRAYVEGCLRLAAHDVPRVVTLRLDGRTVAFHSYFALGGAAISDRLAFDPELARFSPGLLNTLDMLETAAAEGLRRVEFLGGTEDYKLLFADRFEPLHDAVGLASGPFGRLAAGATRAQIRLRRRLRRNERLHQLYLNGFDGLRRRR
jgi:CelD/BcsL family acetyltransferase involved in cellulose biosynthesis